MFKKFISILATAAMLISFAPAMLAEETGGIKTEIAFGDEYSVVGDKLKVNVKISSDKEENAVAVIINYGEEGETQYERLNYVDQISLNEGNNYTFEKECDITVGTADKFTVSVNGDATEKEIVKKDAFEIGDITAEYKQTVTEEETEYLEYAVKTKIKNNHNVKSEKLALAYDGFATEEFAAEAKSEIEKELAVKVKKADMSEEKLTGTLELKADGETAAEKEFELANPYYVSAITINGGKKITLAKDEKITPSVVLEPVGTLSDYKISAADKEIISVDEDNKSITGLKVGKTTLTVKAGNKTVTADAEVLKDRTSAEPENIKLYYYTNETEKTGKTELSSEDGFSYATDSYIITLPQDLSSFKLYYEITGGSLTKMMTTKTQSGKDDTATTKEDGEEKYLQWSSVYKVLTFYFNDDASDESTYRFTIGKAPVIQDFPEEIKVYSDFDKSSEVDFTFELALNQYADDPTEISGVDVIDSDGNKIGKYETDDGEKESKKRYWRYEISKSTKEGTKQPVTFKFKNKDGMVTVKNTTLVYSEDTEEPKWSGSVGISVSSISTSSATVKWSHASDNDRIAYYTLHYYKGTSKGAEKTVKVTYDSTEKPSASISSLSSGTSYTVYIEAFDRTGNSCKSKTDSFTTSKSSSSGSSSSGSSSSSSSSGSSGSSSSGSISGNSGTTSGTTAGKTFTDIDNYGWAKNEIETLTKKGIISGISDTEFGPASNIRRCDFILLISRAYGFNGTFEDNFSDVPSDAYYATAVGLAKKLGILTGMGNNEFNPNGYITRQDMCVMALRAMKVAGKNVSEPTDIYKFADSADIAAYAAEAIGSLAADGIIKGDDNGNANPRKNTTRAEAAVIIYRLLGI